MGVEIPVIFDTQIAEDVTIPIAVCIDANYYQLVRSSQHRYNAFTVIIVLFKDSPLSVSQSKLFIDKIDWLQGIITVLCQLVSL